MQEKKVTVEILPEAAFLIRLHTGEVVKGRFSMYALDRFAEKKGLDNYFEIIGKLTVGMKLHEYAELLLVAFEDYYRRDFDQCCVVIDDKKVRWTVELVFDLVLEKIGGLASNAARQLFEHAVGRLAEVVQADDEKKNGKTQAMKKKR
jgi:hypothetical protein